jgi:CelD/BcsL family acetyltransferase involved in cellulose biosynthesis
MSLTIQICQDEGWVEQLRSQWTELVDHSPSATMFQTWEWQSSWWKQYRGSKRPQIYLFLDGDVLAGILPMTQTRGLWRALLPMGHGKSDYLQPVSRTGYEDEVGKATAQILTGAPGFHYVSMSMIRENQPLLKYLDSRHISPQFGCYVLEVPSEYETYLSTLSERMRRYLKRFDRMSAEEREYKIRLAAGSEVSSALEALFDLHSKRWNERGMPGGFAFHRIRELYRSWVLLANERNWLRLHLLDGPTGPVAAILAATIGETCFCHNIGFDPKYSDIRPGWVVYGASIREAISDGCKFYDFMLGAEEYKEKWKPQLHFRNCSVTYVRPGLRGKAADYWYRKGMTQLIILRRRFKSLFIRRSSL